MNDRQLCQQIIDVDRAREEREQLLLVALIKENPELGYALPETES